MRGDGFCVICTPPPPTSVVPGESAEETDVEGETLLESRQRSQSSEGLDTTGASHPVVMVEKAASWSSLQQVGDEKEEVKRGELLQRKVAGLQAEVRHHHTLHHHTITIPSPPLPSQLSELHREFDRRGEMCTNYEAQLQRVQEQMVADMDEKERAMDRIRAECEKYKVCDSQCRDTSYRCHLSVASSLRRG